MSNFDVGWQHINVDAFQFSRIYFTSNDLIVQIPNEDFCDLHYAREKIIINKFDS